MENKQYIYIEIYMLYNLNTFLLNVLHSNEATPCQMRQTRKAINNLSLCKNIIRKAPIQSRIMHLCASRVQNDALEAILSHSTQAHSAYVHPVRRMVCLRQH